MTGFGTFVKDRTELCAAAIAANAPRTRAFANISAVVVEVMLL